MATKAKAKSPSAAKPPAAAQDTIALLKADHKAVSELFADFGSASSSADKKSIVAETCTALRVHAPIEEEIFYPDVVARSDRPASPYARAMARLRARSLTRGVHAPNPCYTAAAWRFK